MRERLPLPGQLPRLYPHARLHCRSRLLPLASGRRFLGTRERIDGPRRTAQHVGARQCVFSLARPLLQAHDHSVQADPKRALPTLKTAVLLMNIRWPCNCRCTSD